MTFNIKSKSPEYTNHIGECIGKSVKTGDVILLNGDLGAGKTCMTKGILAMYDRSIAVTSPTYTLVNEYEAGQIKFYHYDCYRLSCGDDLYDIGFEDALRDGIIIMEWADNVSDIYDDFLTDENTFSVKIERQDDIDINSRNIILTVPDERSESFAEFVN